MSEVLTWCSKCDTRFEGELDACPNGCIWEGGYLTAGFKSIARKALAGVAACADCGCGLDDHHKLGCEADQCPGCSGWLCPRHNLILCGCTCLGGPEPAEVTA